MNRVLVTGAAGRLGTAMLALLAAEGVSVTAFDQAEIGGPAERKLTGDIADPAAVREAVRGCDAVVHLAAIPTPVPGMDEQVFGTNALGTFTVLNAAGQAGITRAVIASSNSIYGHAFSPHDELPHYLPLDADHPLDIADPYALSKQADEATARMVVRRYGMTVVALRYPFLGGFGDRLPEFAARWRAEPAQAASILWAYMEDRDASRAAWLAVTRPLSGYHMFQVAAPETLVDRPTEELLDEFLPSVPRRAAFPGRTVPVDLRPATELLGFEAAYLYEG